MKEFKDLKIAIAGIGYVGLSITTFLSQHHKVYAVDIIHDKIELINNYKLSRKCISYRSVHLKLYGK